MHTKKICANLFWVRMCYWEQKDNLICRVHRELNENYYPQTFWYV